MDFFRRFTFLFCTPAFDTDDLEGHRLGEITAAIDGMGFQVVRARRIEDAEIVFRAVVGGGGDFPEAEGGEPGVDFRRGDGDDLYGRHLQAASWL